MAMTFREFVEYLLWSLYVRERAHPEAGGAFFDLSESIAALDDAVAPQWLYDATRVLETRGLVRPILALGGYAAAALTGEGRLEVEDDLAKPDSVVYRFAQRDELTAALERIDSGEQVEPTAQEQRAPVLDLLGELELSVDHLGVSDDEKEDLRTDIETVRLQLGKHEPNVDVIAGVLERVRRYRGLTAPVGRILALLYP